MVLRSLIVAALVGSVAAAGTPARSWEDKTIARVDVRGNHAVNADAIRTALASQPGTKFHADTLESDVRALWKLGQFTDVQIEGVVNPRGGLVLTVVVAERAAVRKTLITGNHALSDAAVRDVIDLGAIVDVAAIAAAREHILALYGSEGFISATVSYDIVPAGKDQVDVRFVIDEKHRVSVHDVRFVGSYGFTGAELRAQLQTRAGETYRQEVFERDLLVLSAYYWDRGYANVKVGEPTQKLSADGRTMDITIPIEEGPTFTISGVHATGELLDTEKATLRMLTVRPRTLFSRTVIATDREALSTRYQDEGYSDASILPLTKVDLAHRTIDLTFEVKRGVVATFNRVTILGNSTTSDIAIRNELEIKEGDQFSETALEMSKKHLEALGVFDQVVMSTRHPNGAPELVDVTIEVTERVSQPVP